MLFTVVLFLMCFSGQAGELTGTVGRNVRNLQEAIGLIGEIRAKLPDH